MTDATSPDLARFFERYDNRNRLLFTGALSASLVLSAVNVTHGALAPGGTGAKGAGLLWVFGIVAPPLFTVAWWCAMEFIARYRKGLPPTSADDVRNGLRIANAGFAYNVALTAAGLGVQTVATLAAFGYSAGDWVPRATTVAVGAALIYLGNLWPRMPTPRAPGQKAATRMKVHRVWGWVMVILGLLCLLPGLIPTLLLLGHRP